MKVSGTSEAAPTPGAPVSDGAVRIAVVTHGPASSKFWAIIRNGVDSAARQLDVLVDYKSPDVFSVVRMSALIDQAVATKPDGLVVSIPNAGLAPAIRRAVAAGIPVISINSGSDDFRSLGVLVHVGQVESRAGYEAGKRLAAAGVRNALCLNQDRENDGTKARCAGMAKAHARGGRPRPQHLRRRRGPRRAQRDRPRRRLRAGRRRAGDQLDQRPRRGARAWPAWRSRSAPSTSARTCSRPSRPGEIGFAVDQQPYLQGYLPIEMLALRARYGILPAQHDIVATGPNFVTRANAAQALELSERSIR